MQRTSDRSSIIPQFEYPPPTEYTEDELNDENKKAKRYAEELKIVMSTKEDDWIQEIDFDIEVNKALIPQHVVTLEATEEFLQNRLQAKIPHVPVHPEGAKKPLELPPEQLRTNDDYLYRYMRRSVQYKIDNDKEFEVKKGEEKMTLKDFFR